MAKNNSDAVDLPNGIKDFIFWCVDSIGNFPSGRRLLTKLVAVGNTGIGAGNHDFAGSRTGENRVIGASCKVLPTVVALDIGANHGSWGLELLARCSTSSVVFVEPRERAAQELRARLNGDPRARVVVSAVGESDGKATLFGVDGAGDQASLRSDLLQRASIGVESGSLASEQVQVKRIDSLVAECIADGVFTDATSINVAKVDIEGLEHSVIMQLVKVLGASLHVVQFEFHIHALAQGHTIDDFRSIFGSEFDLFRLAPRVLIPLSELPPDAANYFGYSNWVAVRKNLSRRFCEAYRTTDPAMQRPQEWIY